MNLKGCFFTIQKSGRRVKAFVFTMSLFVFTNQGLRMKNVYAEKIHSKNKKGGTQGSGNAAVNGRGAAGGAAGFYGKGDFF